MLQYSYYQDQSTAEIEAKIRAGRQWLHRVPNEDALQRLYTPAEDGSPPPLVLVGGQLTRPLETWGDDGAKGAWGREGNLVLITNTGPGCTATELAATTGAAVKDILALDDLAQRETIIPGPPPHPHALTVFPSIHVFAGTLRERTGQT